MPQLAPNLLVNQCIARLEVLYFTLKSTNNLNSSELHDLQQDAEKLLTTPDIAMGYAIIGSTYSLLGETAKMIEHFEQALKHSPNDPVINYNYGSALVETHQIEQAIQQFRRSATLENPLAINLELAKGFMQLVCIDEAQAVLNKLAGQLSEEQQKEKSRWETLIKAYQALPKEQVESIHLMVKKVHQTLVHQYPKNFLMQHYVDLDGAIIYEFGDHDSPLEKIWQFDDQLVQFFVKFEEEHNVHLPYFTLMYGKL